jgi:penicillin-binding protein 1A
MKKVTVSGLPAEVWNRFMRAALAGSTPAPLPAVPWEHTPGVLDPSAPPAASTPVASAPSYPPGSGNIPPAPLVMNAGAEAGQTRAGLLPDGGLRPPASIPNTSPGHSGTAPQPRPKSFLEAIFGN